MYAVGNISRPEFLIFIFLKVKVFILWQVYNMVKSQISTSHIIMIMLMLINLVRINIK